MREEEETLPVEMVLWSDADDTTPALFSHLSQLSTC